MTQIDTHDAMRATDDAAELRSWDQRHLIHPQYLPHTEPPPRLFVRGRGSRLFDTSGKEYLDATGGLWLAQIGHGRPEIAETAKDQIEQLEYFASFWDFSNIPAVRLGKRILEIAPPGLEAIYYTTGGSESNEIAIMMARMYHARNGEPDRTIVLSRHNAYHGITYGARAATGLEAFHTDIGPLPGGFHYLTAPNPYHQENATDECIAELERTINQLGAPRIAAMIGEPILGVGGMVVPPDDYWPKVCDLLRRYGILLIVDEVVTAYGRTGTWFAAEQWDLAPDVISTAKGITSGYYPLGAVLVSGPVRDAIADGGFVAGFTYTGHPTACAVALRNLEIIDDEGLLENARVSGDYLLQRLRALVGHPCVGDVRGRGLMLAIELVKDKASKEPALELGAALGRRFTDETGVIIRNINNTLIFSPPLIFTKEDCDEVADAVELMINRCYDEGIRD